jgi:hypothetical protein
MNATDLILTVQSEGVILSLSDSGAIKYEGDEAAVNRWLPAIKERKADILETLKANTAFWRWLIHFPDREPMEVTFSPELGKSEVLKLYPDAVAAEPFDPPISSPHDPLTADEEAIIRSWIASIGETDPNTIEEAVDGCRNNSDARKYFLRLSNA